MSDLQCPARFLVLGPADPGSATTPGPRPDRLLAHLRGENVAAVYTSGRTPADGGALLLAEALGLRVTPVDGLETVDLGAAPLRTVLDGLADRHRGETALVVGGHGSADPSVVVMVEIDADGWRVTRPWAHDSASGSEEPGADVVDAP